MFLINSCSHLVSATSDSSIRKGLHRQKRTFSRSYGTILPSSFTRVLSSALVFSTRPPVSVWGTIPANLKLRRFSWKHGINHFSAVAPRHQLSVYMCPDLPKHPTYILELGQPSPSPPSLLRPPIAIISRTGILTRFPSTTRVRLALGVDSPYPD